MFKTHLKTLNPKISIFFGFKTDQTRGGPTVPEKPQIAVESPISTVPSTPANAQIGQSQPAGGPSSMVSSIPDGFAKPQETPVNVELPIRKGSPECGPTVPKRSGIAVESPTSTETLSTAESQKGQTPPAAFASPNGSPVSAGFAKPHETPNPAVASFPGATSCPARYAEPRTIAFPAKWKEAQARLAQVFLLMESPGAKLEEIESQLAQVSLLVKCSIVDNSEKPNEDSNLLELPILAAGISNPAGSHQGQPQLAI
ncbi:hypothetical protein B9Z55_027079 [Caenorhabditis nigoni]|uniref:Uncharacterized protein n=1 Tax=Caenorhabditis nigoni TaxID=1611254 RepID=A0A2G5SIR9_9PELO|nr:hypothetical protein B9Z55_027079 [Caenorhabditis nigoni]